MLPDGPGEGRGGLDSYLLSPGSVSPDTMGARTAGSSAPAELSAAGTSALADADPHEACECSAGLVESLADGLARVFG